MIKTAPHSTLSPQIWSIKNNKRLVCTHPDLWQEFVNLSNEKIRSDLFSKTLFSMPYLLRSRAIIALKCDRRLFLGYTYRAISTRCKICFTPKSLSFPPKSHMNVPLSYLICGIQNYCLIKL